MNKRKLKRILSRIAILLSICSTGLGVAVACYLAPLVIKVWIIAGIALCIIVFSIHDAIYPTIDDIAWERRFKARILQRLSENGTEWTQEQAEEAAREEFNGASIDEHRSGFENNPEGAADEALSYWED